MYERGNMRLYIYLGLATMVVLSALYFVHRIKEGVRTEIKLETAITAAKVQKVKDEIRNTPVTSNDVIDSLRAGTW